MIGMQTFGGKATVWPFVACLLLFLALAGCGGDKQEEPSGEVQHTPISDQDMVPPSAADSSASEALQPVETAAEVKPFSPPPSPEESEKAETGTPEAKIVQESKPSARPDIDGARVEQAGGNYSIMVGSFLKEINAAERADKIRKLGFAPVQETATIGDQTFHRVHLRGINSYDEAESLGYFLREKLGIDYLVLKR